MEEKDTKFDKEYFLEALPVDWDEELDGEQPHKTAKYNKEGDVQVNQSMLDELKSLGLIK